MKILSTEIRGATTLKLNSFSRIKANFATIRYIKTKRLFILYSTRRKKTPGFYTGGLGKVQELGNARGRNRSPEGNVTGERMEPTC